MPAHAGEPFYNEQHTTPWNASKLAFSGSNSKADHVLTLGDQNTAHVLAKSEMFRSYSTIDHSQTWWRRGYYNFEKNGLPTVVNTSQITIQVEGRYAQSLHYQKDRVERVHYLNLTHCEHGSTTYFVIEDKLGAPPVDSMIRQDTTNDAHIAMQWLITPLIFNRCNMQHLMWG